MSTQVLDMWVVIHGLVKHGLVCVPASRLANKRAAEKGNGAKTLFCWAKNA